MIRIGKDPGSMSTARDIIERDLEGQREAVARAKDSLLQARTGLQDVDAARKAMLDDIDLKGAAMAQKGAALLRANLAARGVPQAQIDADKRIADLEALGAKQKLEVAGRLTTRVDDHFQSAWKQGGDEINRTPTTPKGGNLAGADVDRVNQLTRSVGELDSTIGLIKKNPEAYEEARSAMEAERQRQAVEGVPGVGKAAVGVGKAVGLVPPSPEVGLKGDALRIYQGLNKAQMSLAGTWGGVIRESDVQNAGTQMGLLGSDKEAAIETLSGIKGTMQNGLDTWMANKSINLPPGTPGAGGASVAPPPATPQPQSKPPPSVPARPDIDPETRARVKAKLQTRKPSKERDDLAIRYGIRPEELNGR